MPENIFHVTTPVPEVVSAFPLSTRVAVIPILGTFVPAERVGVVEGWRLNHHHELCVVVAFPNDPTPYSLLDGKSLVIIDEKWVRGYAIPEAHP